MYCSIATSIHRPTATTATSTPLPPWRGSFSRHPRGEIFVTHGYLRSSGVDVRHPSQAPRIDRCGVFGRSGDGSLRPSVDKESLQALALDEQHPVAPLAMHHVAFPDK